MNRLLLPVAGLVMAGCASEPIIDKRGVDPVKYERDLAECRAYSEQVNTPAEMVKHGAIGAAIGGAVGAIVSDSHGAGEAAGVGAGIGATEGMTRSEDRKQQVFHRCLQGRGYRVLG